MNVQPDCYPECRQHGLGESWGGYKMKKDGKRELRRTVASTKTAQP